MNEQNATAEESAASPTRRTRWDRATGALRRYFWLDATIARARKASFSAKDPGWIEFSWARQTRAARAELGDGGEHALAVDTLERAEALFLLMSHCVRANVSPPKSLVSEEAWHSALALPAVEQAWSKLTGAEQSAIRARFAEEGEFSRRGGVSSGLRRFAQVLAEPLDAAADSVERLLLTRWTRLAVALLALGGLAMLIILGRSSGPLEPNLALHRPVHVSSQSASAGVGSDHRMLVDGNPNTLGCHTEWGPNQFVTVDLGAPRTIQRVVVTNRRDCCEERAVPLLLEVSDDGRTFRPIAERQEPFRVWTASGLSARGRYVQLRLTATNILHLSEVEVY